MRELFFLRWFVFRRDIDLVGFFQRSAKFSQSFTEAFAELGEPAAKYNQHDNQNDQQFAQT